MLGQKKLSLGARFGLAVASFVLAVLLFVSAVGTQVIGNMMVVTDEDNIRGLVNEIFSISLNFGQEKPTEPEELGPRKKAGIHRQQAETQQEETQPEDVAQDLTTQLIEMFYEGVAKQLEEEFPVSLEEFTQMIEESTVKDYITDKTSALIVDYINGEVTTTFEPEEIVQLIEENEEIIIQITGEPVPDDIAQEVAKVFDENEIVLKVEKEGLAGFIDMVGGEIPGVSDVFKSDEFAGVGGTINGVLKVFGGDVINWSNAQLSEIINALRSVFSTRNLVIGIVICLVLVAAILLVNFRQLGKGMRRAGYPLLLAGCMVILNLLAMFAPDIWTAFPGLNVVQYMLQQTAWVNITAFGIGLVLVIAGIVVDIAVPKKKPAPAE